MCTRFFASTAIAGPSSGHPSSTHLSSLTRSGDANVRPPSRDEVNAMSRMLPGIDVAPRREERAVGSRGERGLAAVAHAAGDRARLDDAIERRQIELRPLRHRDAVRLLTCVRARLRCSRMIVMRCGDRAVLLRQLAMIEPHGVDAPAAIGDRVLPAAVAGCIAAGTGVGPAQTSGRRRPIATCTSFVPLALFVVQTTVTRRPAHGHARRLFAVEAGVAVDVVDPNRRRRTCGRRRG